ncbi:MAG: DUF805 domain-containing protein [Propionibacteriaceae bacterium]|jgi:uncharacterized membrane protein YhaH (DUF805 family)|nr:DUF805 domain-containing protein [Propionibacteriaceae bacterium]
MARKPHSDYRTDDNPFQEDTVFGGGILEAFDEARAAQQPPKAPPVVDESAHPDLEPAWTPSTTYAVFGTKPSDSALSPSVKPAHTPPVKGKPSSISLPWYGIGPIDAIKRGFRKYGVFTGRASHSEFWWWFAFVAVITILPAIVFDFLNINYYSAFDEAALFSESVAFLLYLVPFIVTAIPSLAVSWRRLHDANLSGLHCFIGLPWIFAAAVAVTSEGISDVLGTVELAFFALFASIMSRPSNPEGKIFDRP